jgi:hypothetical protein
VLTVRQQLRATSDLGEFGATAIHREWLARGLPDPPAIRTIGLILEACAKCVAMFASGA